MTNRNEGGEGLPNLRFAEVGRDSKFIRMTGGEQDHFNIEAFCAPHLAELSERAASQFVEPPCRMECHVCNVRVSVGFREIIHMAVALERFAVFPMPHERLAVFPSSTAESLVEALRKAEDLSN
jgi:hypothetical protein